MTKDEFLRVVYEYIYDLRSNGIKVGMIEQYCSNSIDGKDDFLYVIKIIQDDLSSYILTEFRLFYGSYDVTHIVVHDRAKFFGLVTDNVNWD